MLKFRLSFMLLSVLFVACRSTQNIKQKPAWVHNRPVNELYYIGIGIASKNNNPFDYQQVAKRNAVNDLISEIKVTVSSHSVLSQLQHNKEFTQQFESDVKVTAINTIEEFTVVDSWEDAEFFWIYYKLSKEAYNQQKRRKMLAAIEQAENYFAKADQLSDEQFVQSIRLKIKALASLQHYLNEDIQTVHNGQSVYLVSDIMNSIQNQLYQTELWSKTPVLTGKLGHGIAEPLEILARYRDNQKTIPFVPIQMIKTETKIEGTTTSETDQQGIAMLTVSKINSNTSVQLLHYTIDIKRLAVNDSLSQSLTMLLQSLDAPHTVIRLHIVPIKILMMSKEQNLSQPMSAHYLDIALKKQLTTDGFTFVNNIDSADFTITIEAATRSEGFIWGNMRTVALDMSLSITDNVKKIDIYKDGMRQIKGFQTTDINAGLDAYKTAAQQMLSGMYPAIKNELMRY